MKQAIETQTAIAMDKTIADVLALNPVPGMTISKSWLMDSFGIKPAVYASEVQGVELEFLQKMTSLRARLLEIYMIDLKAIGKGYEVIHPKDQAEHALKLRTKNIGKEISKLKRSVKFTDTSGLTDEERLKHSNAETKASQLESMFRRRNKLNRN